MKKSRVYLAAVLASAALLLAGCPTVKGPPAPKTLGTPKYLTLTPTLTPVPTLIPVAASPVPTSTFAQTVTHSQTLTPDPATPVPGGAPPATPTPIPTFALGGDRSTCSGYHMGVLAASGSLWQFGNSDSATNDYDNDCGSNGSEHMFSFQILETMDVTISTCGSSYDTVLHLSTICSKADINCDDDGGCGATSEITETSLPPGLYYVMVEGYDYDGWGDYVLSITNP